MHSYNINAIMGLFAIYGSLIGAYLIAGLTCAIVFLFKDKKKKEKELAAEEQPRLSETTQPNDGTDNIN